MREEVSPFDIEPPHVLREAFVRDVIDLETFERFVELALSGEPYMLPVVVTDFLVSKPTDAPGAVIQYDSRRSRPMYGLTGLGDPERR